MSPLFRALVLISVLATAASAISSADRASTSGVADAAFDLAGAPPSRGAAATMLRLRRLATTASVLHTTAHPDDEQGGLLAWLAHGQGVRTALLTLNRGEAGDNALGPALFDALGLLRTEELRAAGRFYGLDAQYYTRAADYGFSKRLDEALEQWDRDAVLRDMVRAIRTVRPLVVVSRWQGNDRDGHGQHQAAGALTPEAVQAAADPARFPELAREGLRPWRVRKLYVGGAREEEPWAVRVDTGAFDPLLGDSYQNVARRGLSLQRSQTAGRFVRGAGSAFLYYTRHAISASDAGGAAREATFFDGLDARLAGLYGLLGVTGSRGDVARLEAIAAAIGEARAAFSMDDPAATAPALARALRLTREARDAAGDEDVRFILRIKEREIVEALNAALGIDLQAIAVPEGTRTPSGPAAAYAPPPVLGPLTPGQACDVRVTFASGADRTQVRSIALEGPRAETDLTIKAGDTEPPAREALRRDSPKPGGGGQPGLKPGLSASSERSPSDGGAGLQPGPRSVVDRTFRVRVHEDAAPTRPYFHRASIAETLYTVDDPSLIGRPSAPPLLTAVARYEIDGVEVPVTAPVVRRESNLPYGYELRELEVLPAVTVSVLPRVLMLRAGDASPREVSVEVASQGTAVTTAVSLAVPEGWTVVPAAMDVALGAGETKRVGFSVRSSVQEVQTVQGVQKARQAREQNVVLEARARVGERTYTSGYEIVRARDLPLRYLTREAEVRVRAVDVSIEPGLRVGYVMGVGDEVPAAIAQLGAAVDLLGADDLATGDLSRFDTIVTGTRAYAVRADLRAHNQRLLDYVKAGGNLVVLYNTPELVPGEQSPYPAELPQDAEEICEERAPVELLQPQHPLLATPNRITAADFEGWIEQRGSKFFSSWDAAYTPLLSSHDRGQAPQRGGMLSARVGRGHYTYMAYALHRQLPAGVPGAYRLLANLLSLGRTDPRD